MAQDDGLPDDFVFQAGDVPDDAVEDLLQGDVPVGAGNRRDILDNLLLVDEFVSGLAAQVGEHLLEAALLERDVVGGLLRGGRCRGGKREERAEEQYGE